jgi:hypothetical protein
LNNSKRSGDKPATGAKTGSEWPAAASRCPQGGRNCCPPPPPFPLRREGAQRKPPPAFRCAERGLPCRPGGAEKQAPAAPRRRASGAGCNGDTNIRNMSHQATDPRPLTLRGEALVGEERHARGGRPGVGIYSPKGHPATVESNRDIFAAAKVHWGEPANAGPLSDKLPARPTPTTCALRKC